MSDSDDVVRSSRTHSPKCVITNNTFQTNDPKGCAIHWGKERNPNALISLTPDGTYITDAYIMSRKLASDLNIDGLWCQRSWYKRMWSAIARFALRRCRDAPRILPRV